jgi:hypothetical protein
VSREHVQKNKNFIIYFHTFYFCCEKFNVHCSIFLVKQGAKEMISSMIRCVANNYNGTTLHIRKNHSSRNSVISERIIPYQKGKIGEGNVLSLRLIQNLIRGKIDLVRIPNYCSKELCGKVSERLLNHKIQDYANAPGVGKVSDIGMAFFETIGDLDLKEEYYKKAIQNIQLTRKIFGKESSPLDRFRLELDEIWPHGAQLLRLEEGRPMFTGLVRVLSQEVLPHEDKLERDLGCSVEKLPYISQIAVNFYLKVPKSGGEIILYDQSLSDEEYDRLRGDSYGIDRRILPSPKIEIRPQVGDLTLFNARYLHAVNPSGDPKDKRVSFSTFILYGGDNKPLKFWS